MTVKELMDFLKECPEDADINVKNYINGAQYKYRIEELAGFFDGVKNVVNIYVGEDQGKATTTSRTDRETCTMRHENGNCLPIGGFCLAVNNEICEALQHAYERGASSVRHGHWELSHFKTMFICSYCRQYYISTDEAYDFNYCPHCGAKMGEVTT